MRPGYLLVLSLVLFTFAILFICISRLFSISSTLNSIYVAAVYRYAADGEAGGFFDEEMVRGAFRLK